MRIKVNNISHFIRHLETANVHRRTVYYEEVFENLNGKTMKDATSFHVQLQASAILEFDDNSAALLDCEVDCGIDRTTVDGSLEGSAALEKEKGLLTGYCEQKQLRLLPGTIDI